MTDELGEWRWYFGAEEHDDEMCEAKSRDDAIAGGMAAMPGESFYIVEARMLISDLDEMASGARDSAPFAKTRNGEFITPDK